MTIPKLTLKQSIRIMYYVVRSRIHTPIRTWLLAWAIEKTNWALEVDYNGLGGIRIVTGDGSVIIIQTKRILGLDQVHANVPGIYVGAHVGRDYEELMLLRDQAILNSPDMSPSFDTDWIVPAICGMDYLTSLDGVEASSDGGAA